VSVVTVILPLHFVYPHLTDEAKFCLEAAQDTAPNAALKIAILSLSPHKVYPSLSAYPSVSTWTLDTELWPQDMANNHLIWTALAAYQGLKHNFNPAEPNYIIPLREGLAYFILQAVKSGLLFNALSLTQTVYKPIGLETQARLQLPLNIDPLVYDSLERWCARFGTPLITSHRQTHRDIEIWAEAELKSLTAFMPDVDFISLTANAPLSHHLIFIGNASPVDGFDAFCDLVDIRFKLNHLGKVTLWLTQETTYLNIRANALKRLERLRKKGLKLDIITDPLWDVQNCEPGVIIAPERMAVFPQKIRHIESGQFALIWGTGLKLDTQAAPRPQGAYHSPSDVRRLSHILETGEAIQPLTAFSPPPLPQPSPRCTHISPPKLSVIVLHKDRPALLKQTLASLKAQSLTDFELVLVDDGSRPEVQAQLQPMINGFSFAQSQIILLDGLYPGEARNQGAKATSGDALFFMDDDNLLAPETLSDFAKALQANDVVMSFYQRLNPDIDTPKGQSTAPAHVMPAYGFIGPHPSAGLFHNMMGNSFIMIRKDAFETLGGYSPEYGIGLEDYAFMLRAADLDFVILPEPYLHFREHGEKIRLTHIDWRSDIRLQAGQWRIMRELPSRHLSPLALGYARQLHEITGQQYVPQQRPRFFNLRTIVLHQYIRPFIRNLGLRQPLQKIAARNGPVYRMISRLVFRRKL